MCFLGAFFWTYAIAQLPAGHFIDRLGARVTYPFAVLWWSVFTALAAVATGAASLFGYRTVWGMMLGFFCLSFVIYFFITWFPTYLHDARGFSLLGTGFYGVIPALVAILGGWFGGWVSDRIYDRTGDLNKARKTCLIGGMLFSSVIACMGLVGAAAYAFIVQRVEPLTPRTPTEGAPA